MVLACMALCGGVVAPWGLVAGWAAIGGGGCGWAFAVVCGGSSAALWRVLGPLVFVELLWFGRIGGGFFRAWAAFLGSCRSVSVGFGSGLWLGRSGVFHFAFLRPFGGGFAGVFFGSLPCCGPRVRFGLGSWADVRAFFFSFGICWWTVEFTVPFVASGLPGPGRRDRRTATAVFCAVGESLVRCFGGWGICCGGWGRGFCCLPAGPGGGGGECPAVCSWPRAGAGLGSAAGRWSAARWRVRLWAAVGGGGVRTLEWSGRGPGLGPVEILWRGLGGSVHARGPYGVAELQRFCGDGWAGGGFPPRRCGGLVAGCRGRLIAVVAAGGGPAGCSVWGAVAFLRGAVWVGTIFSPLMVEAFIWELHFWVCLCHLWLVFGFVWWSGAFWVWRTCGGVGNRGGGGCFFAPLHVWM